MAIDLEETFVYDGIVHAYNLLPSNYHNVEHAELTTQMLYGFFQAFPDGYQLTLDGFVRDWTVEETANLLFRESYTDMATFHPLPINAFEDGLTSVEKAREAVDRWPNRFNTFAAFDPLRDDPIEELERQVDLLDPIGLKLYPISWRSDSYEGWRMDDSQVAFPIFERARELGIDFITIHKAVPFGPVARDALDPRDVPGAAETFPGIDFCIAHGGAAYSEETAWLLGRFQNVYVNLEGLGIILTGNPTKFADIYAKLLSIGGPDVVDRLFWSSSTSGFPPQPQLEALRDFDIPDDIRAREGFVSKIPQITDEDKRKILGKNYARKIGLDIDRATDRIEDDEFSHQMDQEGIASPFSTTSVPAAEVM